MIFIIEDYLPIEQEKDSSIEKTHKIGKSCWNSERKKDRTIVDKFLNGKLLVLSKFREKKLWNKQRYLNEHFSEEMRDLRKKSYWRKAKQMRERDQNGTVLCNKIVVRNDRDCVSRDENENGD